MKFWDASAVLPLLLQEAETGVVQRLYQQDPGIAVWCLTDIEVASALARRSREGFETKALARARTELGRLMQHWVEMNSVQTTRSRALRQRSGWISTPTARAPNFWAAVMIMRPSPLPRS